MLEVHLCGFFHVFTKSHIGIISLKLCTMQTLDVMFQAYV
jgi:hypothetical protein